MHGRYYVLEWCARPRDTAAPARLRISFVFIIQAYELYVHSALSYRLRTSYDRLQYRLGTAYVHHNSYHICVSHVRTVKRKALVT